jgi:hypothetical protein
MQSVGGIFASYRDGECSASAGELKHQDVRGVAAYSHPGKARKRASPRPRVHEGLGRYFKRRNLQRLW